MLALIILSAHNSIAINDRCYGFLSRKYNVVLFLLHSVTYVLKWSYLENEDGHD